MEEPQLQMLETGNRLAIAIALPVSCLYIAFGLWGSLVGVMPLLVYSVVLYRFIRLSSTTRVTLLLSLLLFAILAAAVTERPVTMGGLAWVCVLPLVATTLQGGRAGFVWSGIGVLTMIISAVCIHFDVFWSMLVPSPLAFQTSRLASISLATFAFAKLSHDSANASLRKALEADEAKTVFLANISHEIRTPLNGVLGMTEAMLLRPLAQTDRDDLEVVQRSGVTLLRLINDLLDLTKAERHELPIEAITFDLDRLLRDVMEFATAKPGVRLRLDADRYGSVRGDPTRLRQILSNLMSNAIKFTEAGEIVLRVQQLDEGRRAFEVSDTGMGMNAQTLSTLFTPFKQADASIARRFGGTGLGLALVKSLTERMGGNVGVSSTLGEGTTIRVELHLPLSDQATPAVANTVPDLRGVQVLVVDDNSINLRVAQAMLSRLQCTVVTADTGEGALELLSQRSFDLVLMDCQLPGIDGWEATRRLLRLPGREAVPVVALTASATRDDLERSRRAGMRHTLTKPLVFTELCQVMTSFTAARSA